MAVRMSALRAGCLLPAGRFLILISVRSCVHSGAIVRLETLHELKKNNGFIGYITLNLPASIIVL
jgi:hypothetical protein